jgi:hypothetical protein
LNFVIGSTPRLSVGVYPQRRMGDSMPRINRNGKRPAPAGACKYA